MAPQVTLVDVDFYGELPSRVARTLAMTLREWIPAWVNDDRWFYQQLLYSVTDQGGPQPLFNACLHTLDAMVAELWPQYSNFRGFELDVFPRQDRVRDIVLMAIELACMHAERR